MIFCINNQFDSLFSVCIERPKILSVLRHIRWYHHTHHHMFKCMYLCPCNIRKLMLQDVSLSMKKNINVTTALLISINNGGIKLWPYVWLYFSNCVCRVWCLTIVLIDITNIEQSFDMNKILINELLHMHYYSTIKKLGIDETNM